MKRANYIPLLLVTVVFLCALPSYGAVNAEGEIRALEQKWQQAFNAKDASAIMKLYEPGKQLIVFDVVPPRQYVGYDAYKKDWEDFFATFDGPANVELSDLKIGTDADLAYSHSFQHVTGKGKDGKPIDFTVRVTDVYRKTGGTWTIVHEHVSVPVDLETGKADLQSKPLTSLLRAFDLLAFDGTVFCCPACPSITKHPMPASTDHMVGSEKKPNVLTGGGSAWSRFLQFTGSLPFEPRCRRNQAVR